MFSIETDKAFKVLHTGVVHLRKKSTESDFHLVIFCVRSVGVSDRDTPCTYLYISP